jgi:hypothetical protein
LTGGTGLEVDVEEEAPPALVDVADVADAHAWVANTVHQARRRIPEGVALLQKAHSPDVNQLGRGRVGQR